MTQALGIYHNDINTWTTSDMKTADRPKYGEGKYRLVEEYLTQYYDKKYGDKSSKEK